ncbi:MAG: PEP-CTERM sorting domain-containing protein [Planctomycetota bacterium]|jgi:type 1 fimbria pilin
MRIFAWAVAALLLLSSHASADISYVSGTYTQDFDGLFSTGSQTVAGRGPHAIQGLLGAVGVEGWYGANPTGSSANTEFRAQNGSQSGNAGRGVVSFGSTGSSDRALGALPTSNQINSFGVIFTNDSGTTLTDLTIAFTGEQWRSGEVNISNTLTFLYGIGSSINDASQSYTQLDFSSPNISGSGALDGNDPLNQLLRSATISGLNWQAGEKLALRWNMNEVTGQDSGLAIDDFSFSATAVPEPSALGLLAVAGVVAGGLRRKRS